MVPLDTGALWPSWGFGGGQAKHYRTLSIDFCGATGLTPFRSMREFWKETKALSAQGMPRVPTNHWSLPLGNIPSSCLTSFQLGNPSVLVQARAILFCSVEWYSFSSTDTSQFRDAVLAISGAGKLPQQISRTADSHQNGIFWSSPQLAKNP